MPAFLKNKWLWIGLALLIVLLVGFTIVRSAGAAKKAEAAAEAEKKVESPYAAIANGKVDVEGGIIQIAARRGGVVREVLVQEGDRVTAGQILARQEDDEPRLALQTAAANLSEAESQLRLINVDIATAQREYDRLQKLVSTNFVAAQRLDQARDAIASAQARLGSQQSAVQTARARRDEAAYNVELTVIRAPADGRIVRRYANPGAGASTLNVSNMFDLEPDAPASPAPRSSRPTFRTSPPIKPWRSPRKATRRRSMSARFCAAPPSSAPASWRRTTRRNAPTSAWSRWWSPSTRPRC